MNIGGNGSGPGLGDQDRQTTESLRKEAYSRQATQATVGATHERDWLIQQAVRIVTAWSDEPDALGWGATLLLKARRWAYEACAA